MCQGQVSDQSGMSCYTVITASSYKVAVLIMSYSLWNTQVHKPHTKQVLAQVCNL